MGGYSEAQREMTDHTRSLLAASERVSKAVTRLEQVMEKRDDLIRLAVQDMSYQEVADAAGITKGRIQQIVKAASLNEG
jgi:DNA-directed RNA polymerase specialized sigma24 family protein